MADELTFGGGGLDRAAHLRGTAAVEALRAMGRHAVLWRGKPLLSADKALGWLAADHPAIRGRAAVFIGMDGEQGLFATDLSDWDPEDGSAAVAGGFMDQTRQSHPLIGADLGFEDLRQVMTRLSPLEGEIAVTAKALLHWHRSHGFCASCGAASQPGKSGWQRDCPSCGTQHFPRTDPVVIMLVEREDRLLLGRSPGWPVGMYSLLAGFVEPGETIEAAVRREVFEEAAVRVGRVQILATQPWPWPASLMIGARAEAVSWDIRIDPAEIEDARWVTRSELATVLSGAHPVIRPGRKGAIAKFLMTNWLADCLG
jgi:NAD+ diphosphatase